MENTAPPKTPDATSHCPVRVAIVGGGLAGLAAAVALSGRGMLVELFEARRRLGGRAGSYLDRDSGELVDHCQHVAMGCCTNYLDFCRRTLIDDLFERYRVLHFFGPDGRRSDFRPARWLPPPLHLLPALLRLGYLSLAEKAAIARAMRRLIATLPRDHANSPTVLQWLEKQRQPPRAIESFWQVVLVSTLGESIDRASLAAARKVFVGGFMAHRDASDVLVPRVPLGELYDRHVADWLRARGVAIHLESPVEQIAGETDSAQALSFPDGRQEPFDFTVLAVPWRRAAGLLAPNLRARVPILALAEGLPAAPITGVHLWLDRKITNLPHAVLVGRLSQWVFARPDRGHYYQVVISASHELAGRGRESVVDEVLADLRAVFPAAASAALLRSKLITEPEAVFSVRPGCDQARPGPGCYVRNLVLAGDWTRTGWPATMEGAVRSGYLAAEWVLGLRGQSERLLVHDLPRGWLVRLLGARD